MPRTRTWLASAGCQPTHGRSQTGAARVPRRHGDEMPAVPCQLVIQLAAELEPALIENGFVQAGLGLNVSTRILDIAFGRLAVMVLCR
jgi:hypothetical protein